MTRHFLTGAELTSAELERLVDRALELKADRLASRALEGRSVALVFDLPSTRTRVSFETGVYELGGHPLVLREGELQLARGESARDTALVLSRMVQAIAIRTPAQETVEALAEHGSVPVINMLTREHHPCQALADLVTLRERFGTSRACASPTSATATTWRARSRLGELAWWTWWWPLHRSWPYPRRSRCP